MEKIKKLKQQLKKEKIDGYLIPKNDEFFGEYVPSYNDRLNYISDFTGSYGFSIILKNKNYLFVDGRYTLQASRQSGRFFEIATFPKSMPSNVLKGKKFLIGYDPKLFTKKTLKIFFGKNKFVFIPLKNNLIDQIWKRKVCINEKKFYCLPNNAVGENYKSKIKKVVKFLKRVGADYQFVSASENNAWLLNIRGADTKYSPIPNSYALIDKNSNIKFFCNLNKISLSLRRRLKKIEFHRIDSFKEILSKIKQKKFILDENSCSIYFEKIILKNNKIVGQNDPIYNFKAIKNKREIENIKLAHLYDGSALTKYLFWVKKNFNIKKITEISASKKLLEFRKKNKNFKFASFPTISGTGPNGAIVHYKATKETNRVLKKGDIYLVDSGGQYEFGTTDVTRTISLKNTSARVKNIFTRVLKGHIAVANFKLKNETSGSKIDIEARRFLRQIGLNYSHGTGHGVGYFLNVHEGPHSISKNNRIRFKTGMIVSNEPGYYEKNKFGIRIENLIYVKKKNKQNLFETLTLAPIDKELINENILNKKEKDWLNNYHKTVYNNLKKTMSEFEINELEKACSAI